MRDLPHIMGQVFNTPLLIHTPKLETVLGAVGNRILRGEPIAGQQPPEPRADSAGSQRAFSHGGYLCEGGIAVLPVIGTLIRRGSWLDSYSGLMSYDAVSAAIREMMESPSVRGIMLEIDSFGGEAGGCFDLVAEIRQLSTFHRKPIWAVANEAAASAAYAIATAAEQIWLPQMGIVGSVGVVCAHVDMSKSDEMDGLKWTYIFAGEHKVDGNPHEPLSDDVKARLQADTNDIASKFHALVAWNRGLSVDHVRSTQAAMFRGKDAIAAHLANKVGTFDQAMNAFAARLSNGSGSSQRMGSQSTRTGENQMIGQSQKRTAEENSALWDRANAKVAARYGLTTGGQSNEPDLSGWDRAVMRASERGGLNSQAAPDEPAGTANRQSPTSSMAASWDRAIARAAAKRAQTRGFEP